ncbi:MAG TPA: TetR/AcrR family transcriptional regulator [Acidimicrobiales bacterium]
MPEDQGQGTHRLSLAQEQRELTRDRIRKAAMEVVALRGFDATVDEIARVSHVSPRTIFRYYQSQDRLIVGTVKDMLEACARPPVEGLLSPTDDFDGWLEGLASTIHSRNAEILGAASWDIHGPTSNVLGALSELVPLRREYRLHWMSYIVSLAWRTAGGTGEPPEDLAMAFFLNFSPLTTQALMADLDRSPAQIGALTADILKMLLRRAVEAQRSAGGDVSTDADGGEGPPGP